MRKYDYIIVGCGLYGTVSAERLKSKGKKVLVIERRDHIGGNCFSYEHPGTNIEVHKYGTHIFHTDNKKVWDYVNSFVEFNRYRHRVLTTYKGKVYTMPINLGTINAFYGLDLKPSEVGDFIASKRENIKDPRNLEEKAISLIGKDLYEAFIKGYTMKQWNCDPKELPAEIITRLPVRRSYNDSYFNDYYQGIPKAGYTAIFRKMLNGIPVELNTDFFDDKEGWLKRCNKLIYTGPIDKYFGYSLGRLKWRSLKFETENLNIDDFQGTSVMNYADSEIAYTRIHEPKHLHLEKEHTSTATVIVREYPHIDDNEPYYPVNSESDKVLGVEYNKLAAKEKRVIFGGRLAEYKYYDMDEIIESALKTENND
ncbi:MAG: UDP-galactopyranose mutase [Candidatus Omnitrophota bacterium]